MLDAEVDEPAAAATAEPVPAAPTTPATDAGDAAPTDQPPVAPTVRKIQGPAAEPIELSDVAGSAVLKRLLPLFGGLVVLLLVLRRLRK
jgi:hypothetical protein